MFKICKTIILPVVLYECEIWSIMHGRGGKCTRFWWAIVKERGLSEDWHICGGLGSKRILRRLVGGEGVVEWIYLAEDREWWWAVVNMVMNLQVLVSWSSFML
jgi:hypothetical protein